MRDVGFLVWIILLFVGVIGSVVSSVRKQSQQASQQRTAGAQTPTQKPSNWAPTRWTPKPVPAPLTPAQAPLTPARTRPRPPTPAKAPPTRAAIVEHHTTTEHRARRAPALFGNGNSLVRAVIAAEVLGKPRGLADEYPFR